MNLSRNRMSALVLALLLMLGAGSVFIHPVRAAAAAPGAVSVVADPTVALVRWPAVAGAAGYRVSLIRLRDMGVMQQQTVPASQLAFDAQPLFPGEQYEVAVEAQASDGSFSAPVLSAPFSGRALDHSQYAWLADGNNPAGDIDHTLLMRVGETTFEGPYYSEAFTNAQLHYHLGAACPTNRACGGDQNLAFLVARNPVDLSGGRTVTVSGQVDFHGDAHEWVGLIVAPQISESVWMDEEDRSFQQKDTPAVELFNNAGRIHLLYTAGGGAKERELGSIASPINLVNVRDAVSWQLSQTRYHIEIDGQVAFDGAWPSPLPFSSALFGLGAQDYPGSGGVGGQPAVDESNGVAATWHTDDLAISKGADGAGQPATSVYLPQNCAFPSGAEATYQAVVECASQTVNTGGSTISWTIPGVDVGDAQSASLAFDGYRLQTGGSVQFSVNGSAWMMPPYEADRNAYATKHLVTEIPANLLVSGTNTIRFRQATANIVLGVPSGVPISNVELTVRRSTPYVPAALPTQPAPLFTWQADAGTPTPTPSPITMPSIAGVSPAHAAVGATIIIDGANLGDATAVKFSGVTAQFMIHGPGELMATVPSGTTSGPLTVITPEGQASIAFTVDAPAPGTIPLDGAPCVVLLAGKLTTGTCDGEFTPAAA